MPPRKQVESLEHMCFMVMAGTLHRLAVELEEEPESCQVSAEELSSTVASLPAVINENMITKVIETIHQTVSRTRRTIGMRTCLEVLLQPHVQRLDLSGLFFKMRLPVAINMTIRNVVREQVGSMKNLMILNMVSKCSDEILCIVSQKCPNITEVIVSISDLVTDEGLKALALGCPKLEKLGISKCWEVTTDGIAYALQYGKNLQKLQCDQLGAVMINRFKKSNTTFKLTHFEQTQTLFEPQEEEIAWVGGACPCLESASLFVDDESLALVPQLGDIRVLEIETSAILGNGFVKAITNLGVSLLTLQLNCDEVNQEKIVLLGKCCPCLTTLHLTTATVEGDELLINPGQLFSSLTALHLQVWKETVISNECVEFFLMWCHKLESVVLKAELEFLTDQYLKRILAANPLTEAKRIIIASEKHVPLTLESVYRLMASCPSLENLGISSWDITEEEFFKIRDDVRKNNYNFMIS
ncbi:EIN3-binding F-box protein 1-like isoform X1 [Homarus americanus]|uniref:F-box/LRR-repeat protein 4-like 1 n=1 Tax=Homarus americanus TaxID=6706 RepID=A0A8J5JML0_HOMAM|nr:EIN3-binding F-box protein 1-like isoform X1 [Homarus americanus]XP_042239994.1 EIN3-binding F-box protein 1-like isoform X1 [Homarus americanus]XP_042239995.1 EIN3-binding F-box protein 1-like isoform X1 [Homarus americanus]KAG7158876.1 F-box/LRR-repeat protein 4-like 1 [Homarus americanus]